MDFSKALELIKDGKLLQRSSWPDDTFVYLVDGSKFTVNRAPLLGIFPEGKVINYQPHIDMHEVGGKCSVWNASNADLVADDWRTVSLA